MLRTNEHRRIKTEQEPEIPTTKKEAVVPEWQINKRPLQDLETTLRRRNEVDLEETHTSRMINAVHPEVDTELVQLLLAFDNNYLVTEVASRTLRRKGLKVDGRD